ncbi:hypothetical protein CNR22_00120 [Sphingobacteriaceae bacterium]|nr:hypothetical protein CNR22_00120 [Sphingobacteriaceae bacterium]
MRKTLVKLRHSRTKRIISAFLLLNLIAEIVAPTIAVALTSGPSQPEFASFEPVATTDMVNDFTGDFTYNLPVLSIPGPDGGGYSMSLSYHSGESAEAEASWVGYGWTLNPGAINRNKRGFADEHNDIDVIKYNKTRRNWTQSARFDFNMEYNSSDQRGEKGEGAAKAMQKIKKKLNLSSLGENDAGGDNNDPADISISLAHTVRYNNYSGFSIANGFGVTIFGLVGVNMNRSGGQNTYGFSVNPKTLVRMTSQKKAEENYKKMKDAYSTNNCFKQYPYRLKAKFLSSAYNIQSFQAPQLSYSIAKYDAAAWRFSGSVRLNPFVAPIGFQVGIAGDMSVQTTKDQETLKGYGYMFSNKSTQDVEDGVLLDYMIEKESTFDKHDKYLGIPFNTADYFSASGNNVSGGFRMQFDSIGTYYPNLGENTTKIRHLSIELGIGNPFSIGTDLGIGKSKLEVNGKWKKNDNMHNQWGKVSPKMRFTNDKGGEVRYNQTNGYNYSGVLNSKVDLDKNLSMPLEYELAVDADRKRSSSNIKYAYDAGEKHITGIEITDKEGVVNNYGRPVYTRNEFNLTIDVDKPQDTSHTVLNPLYYTDPLLNHTAVGQMVESSYASTYLLSSTTTYNYVDADGNGKPSENDFGGWTKFGYKQALNGQLYRYRAPYNGLFFDHGRLVSKNDQRGSMSSGEKEIFYLNCIETKSHIAFFVTDQTTSANFTSDFPEADYPFLYVNSIPLASVIANIEKATAPRKDGLDAAAIAAGKDIAANSRTAKGTHRLQKLEKIVLFSKADLKYPVTTTYFEYDYSLCKGLPNSEDASGKLTLKRLWTESNGIVKSQIAPYQFHYEYFHNYPDHIKTKYDWANEFSTKYTDFDQKQNPNYNPKNVDPWGAYMVDGVERFGLKKIGISQKANADFEPAPWQLKRIQLPSGGEIHIHYEQKDYKKVQNEKATALVSIKEVIEDGYKSNESEYVINTEDLDVTDAASYLEQLQDYFLQADPKPRLYFKFLYNFCGSQTPYFKIATQEVEYITGYTTVDSITAVGSDIHFHLGQKKKKKNKEKDRRDKTLPRYACYQELLTNGGRSLGTGARDYVNDDVDNEPYAQDPKKIGRERVLPNTVNMFRDWIDREVKNVKRKDACRTFNKDLSYFRVPVFNAKKGGGLRVCRLLSYDPGMESNQGDASVFGSEYFYKTDSGESSGIATNEPTEMREENGLVSYMDRNEQFWLDRIMNGRDTKQYEGPLGESLLPSAEVVHSRIVIKNIHSGKSTTGFVVNKYFTPSDGYEMKVGYSTIERKGASTYRKFGLQIPLGLLDFNIAKAWITQGFIFTLNDMSGKLHSKTVYPGVYDAADFANGHPPVASNQTLYNYTALREQVKTMTYDHNSNTFKNATLSPGTEEDYTVFETNVKEKTTDLSVEIDLNIYWGPIALQLGLPCPTFNYDLKMLHQHVTSKVVHLATHLRSVTNINNGVEQTTETLAYDNNTGDPVLTCTYDGYMSPGQKIKTVGDISQKHEGYYFSLNIPASWMYSSMGQKSASALNTNQLTTMAGNVVTYGSNTLYDHVVAGTNWSPVSNPLTNVVSATATEFLNNWFADFDEHPLSVAPQRDRANDFYYPSQTYVYRADVKSANDPTGKIYSAGVFSNTPFSFYDWSTQTPPSNWYSASQIARYSPNGYPLEEKDALDIWSSAKFGYNHTLPVTVAQNARYTETVFKDFEQGSASNPNINRKIAHSGLCSHDLIAGSKDTFATAFPVEVSRGLAVKVWLRSMLSESPNNINYGLKNPNPKLSVIIGSSPVKVLMKPIAQTGEWTLYSAEIKDFSALQIQSGVHDIKLDYLPLTGETVYVDDFRVQPLDASMNCSVYYPDHKLAAQFDDQHFAVFYEYNEKGLLIRKSIETERGRKTLQEQQYNTPLKTRTIW